MADDYAYGDEDDGYYYGDNNGSAYLGGQGGGDGGEAAYYDPPYSLEQDVPLRGVWVSVGWTIIACGTAGHLMTMVVLLSSRRMRSQPLAVHLVALSLAGLASLYFGLLREVVHAQSTDANGLGIDLRRETSELGCKFHVMFTYVSLQLYSWLQATIAVDRLVSICWPIAYRKACTHRANAVADGIQLAVLVGCSGFVAHVNGSDGSNTCQVLDDHLFKVWEYVDLVVFSALPAAVMLPSNVATLMLIRTRLQTKLHVQRSWPVTAMLLTINAVFIVTTLPISVAHFAYAATSVQTGMWLRAAFSLFQYAGSASSFLFYCVAGSNFRKAIADVFSCKDGARHSSLSVRSSVLKTDSQEGQGRCSTSTGMSCL